MSIKEQILQELSKGDRYACELKDALRIEYRQLWSAIADLKKEGKITNYFRSTPPSATLTFTLSEEEKKPIVTWWNKDVRTIS